MVKYIKKADEAAKEEVTHVSHFEREVVPKKAIKMPDCVVGADAQKASRVQQIVEAGHVEAANPATSTYSVHAEDMSFPRRRPGPKGVQNIAYKH